MNDIQAEKSRSFEVIGPLHSGYERVLTTEALAFVENLHRQFNTQRQALLKARQEREAALHAGQLPDFLPETAEIRAAEWQVAPTPDDLQDRRVEITGPCDRKMMINALNSGAKVFMADMEDALSPTWENIIAGQINLMDAVRRTIRFEDPAKGKTYELNEQTAVLLVRPRGWHLEEKHVLVNGHPISASLFDFGLYFFHNARTALERGSGPYFYLPKLESHLEARLWNDVFNHAQDTLGIPRGTIRATVLIENILAAYEMEEILYELRDHMAGLNAGRWDYIFSAIKKFRRQADYVLPDRAQVTMTVPFMRAYTELMVHICHKRGAHAIGGMSAFIPNSREPKITAQAIEKVREDKSREAREGCDGTWVAHPGLVPPVLDIFDTHLGDKPHQKDRLRDDVRVSGADLCNLPATPGEVTEDGVRTNINVALQYIESWLNGNGAAAINNLMEDAATAEISRAQLWQWLHHNVALADGRALTKDLYAQLRDEELASLRSTSPEGYAQAVEILDKLVLADTFIDFLTLVAYDYID
ncbi:MAG: malate synthase A [Anaerolineales bacterium]